MSHEIWTFVGRPLADAPSACKQAAYDEKSKNQTALIWHATRARRNGRGLRREFEVDVTNSSPVRLERLQRGGR